MPRQADLGDVVAAILDLPPGVTRLVGIDGPGGAGKSTLAEQVAEQVQRARPDEPVSVVHVDDFSGPAFAEWDWTRFREQLLVPLLAGRVARYQLWDWGLDAPARWSELVGGGVVLVEGVSSTRAEVGAPWSLTVWVDAPAKVRRRRAIERDGAATWATWRDHWIPSEQAYIAREHPQERVDLLVSGVD